MQVFLPNKSYMETARVLDKSRLGNQCYRECLTLYRGSWPNHPASKMWANHKYQLCIYAFFLAREGDSRGQKWGKKWMKFWWDESKKHKNTDRPPFVGDEKFHASHRSNLIKKGVQDATFLLLKNNPDFPKRKGEWNPEVYERAWQLLGGKPQNHWYNQFGWKESDNLKYEWRD